MASRRLLLAMSLATVLCMRAKLPRAKLSSALRVSACMSHGFDGFLFRFGNGGADSSGGAELLGCNGGPDGLRSAALLGCNGGADSLGGAELAGCKGGPMPSAVRSSE